MTNARAMIKDVNFIHLCICLVSSERKRGFQICPGNFFKTQGFLKLEKSQKSMQGLRENREKRNIHCCRFEAHRVSSRPGEGMVHAVLIREQSVWGSAAPSGL